MMISLPEAPPQDGVAARRPDPLGWGPPPRPRLRPVLRPRLLAALGGADAAPFVVLVAPAGYGKTTLLDQWCARDPRPSARVTLDRHHDDPLLLLRAIARAVDEAGAGAPGGRIVLVLDDVHVVSSRAALQTLAAMTKHPPAGMTIALASRADLPLPVARLQAQNLVTELRAADLAMTRAEASALYRAAGLALDAERMDELIHRTEGWPVALALAALAPAGGDRMITEFLRDEVLAGLDLDEREFVRRTALLDELIAPLCDAVVVGSDAAGMLARLRRRGFPLVALDRAGERHRHHRLLAELLAGELRRTEPRLQAALHRRASDWHASAGEHEPALRHALAAGDADRAAALVWAGVPAALERGATATVEHRLGRFTPEQISAHPRLAVAAAGLQLACGQGDQAECWVRAAAAAAAPAGEVAVLRAALGREGLAHMRAGAQRASALLSPDSSGQALCRLLEGVGGHLLGDLRAGRSVLEDGARRAAIRVPHVQALCLAQLALMALDEEDPEGAARLAGRARAQVERHGLERCATSALALAASALVRAGRGREDDAGHDLRDATRLAERLTDMPAWYELELSIVLARAALRLGDAAHARLAEAHRLATRVPDAPVLEAWLRSADAAAARFADCGAGTPAALTAAELRTLRFLPTHLSFREIGDRTSVTANTVKTQVNSAYRKLGVRCRSDAVERARALGLLEA